MNNIKLTFKTLTKNEDHNWDLNEGMSLTTGENFRVVENTLNNKGSIIIEHWKYCGGQAPSRQIFDDFDDFKQYLEEHAYAGDVVDIWSMHEILNKKNQLISGKCPDTDGKIPLGGSY